ncbi:cytochrome P450 [Mycena olivaceomarginata]|nr:cytochrome P450 [Mycena olivaceomarginata]
MSRPFFNKERISDFDLFDRHTHDALSRVKQRLAEGYAVDIQDCVSRFTLDFATAFLFGASVSSLAAGFPYPSSAPAYLANSPAFLAHPSNTYVRAFTQGQILMVERAAFGSKWPLAEFWKDKVKPHRVVADAYVEDKEAIRDSIFNILVAGRDTTAATLTFAVYLLAEHPAMAARLRREVLAVVGGTRMPTYDDIRGVKYLRAFINETLRLYPPAIRLQDLKPVDKPLYVTPNSKSVYCFHPYLCRVVHEAVLTPKKNSRVRYSVFLMHRRTDLWGPDALEFDPDRFLDERLKKYLTPNPLFSSPSMLFAYNEASFFLIRLVLALRTRAGSTARIDQGAGELEEGQGGPGNREIMLSRHLTMFAKGGLWVKMKPAPGASDGL